MAYSATELQVLAGIASSPSGQFLIQTFEARLAALDQNLRHLDGNDLLRAQGKAQALEEILRDLRGASDQILRLTRPAKTQR